MNEIRWFKSEIELRSKSNSCMFIDIKTINNSDLRENQRIWGVSEETWCEGFSSTPELLPSLFLFQCLKRTVNWELYSAFWRDYVKEPFFFRKKNKNKKREGLAWVFLCVPIGYHPPRWSWRTVDLWDSPFDTFMGSRSTFEFWPLNHARWALTS